MKYKLIIALILFVLGCDNTSECDNAADIQVNNKNSIHINTALASGTLIIDGFLFSQTSRIDVSVDVDLPEVKLINGQLKTTFFHQGEAVYLNTHNVNIEKGKIKEKVFDIFLMRKLSRPLPLGKSKIRIELMINNKSYFIVEVDIEVLRSKH